MKVIRVSFFTNHDREMLNNVVQFPHIPGIAIRKQILPACFRNAKMR